jgi:hypothetical protein
MSALMFQPTAAMATTVVNPATISSWTLNSGTEAEAYTLTLDGSQSGTSDYGSVSSKITVGGSAGNNHLQIQYGASIAINGASGLDVGASSTSSGNSIELTGSGNGTTTNDSSTSLYIGSTAKVGASGSNNSLLVQNGADYTNGGSINIGYGVSGDVAQGRSNNLTVRGYGSTVTGYNTAGLTLRCT